MARALLRGVLGAVSVGLACLAVPAVAVAQAFPAKPLRIIVPYQPSGLVDMMGRLLARHVPDVLGQPVVVENRAGSAGAVGIEVVRQAAPDGHTLLVMDPALVITPIVDPKTGWNARRDLQVVSIFAEAPLVLTVGAGVPANDLAQLIALARARPGKLNYSSAGIGTTLHMSGELLKAQAGVDIVHVPYKGGSAAIADVLAGQIQMTFLASGVVAQYVKDGRLRAIASTASRRSRLLPDVPTIAESGLPNFDVSVWIGLFAPRGTPPDAMARLNAAVKAALDMSEVRTALDRADLAALGLSGPESERLLEREEPKWTEVVRANNVKPD